MACMGHNQYHNFFLYYFARSRYVRLSIRFTELSEMFLLIDYYCVCVLFSARQNALWLSTGVHIAPHVVHSLFYDLTLISIAKSASSYILEWRCRRNSRMIVTIYIYIYTYSVRANCCLPS